MIELKHMDCMEYMRTLPDKAFDLAIVDPPYGINFGKTHTGKGWLVRESKDWDKTRPEPEYYDELRRVSKHQIVWGGNYLANHLPPSQGWIFWDKGQRGFSLADGELAYTSFDRALRVFTYSRGQANVNHPKFHPTAKPVALYKWLLKNYAEAGSRILDTHLGSGSIAIACHDMGFDLVGCEIDPEYITKAQKRLEDHQSQLALFQGAAS